MQQEGEDEGKEAEAEDQEERPECKLNPQFNHLMLTLKSSCG